jgi:lipopolysaccharide transport system permease protein
VHPEPVLSVAVSRGAARPVRRIQPTHGLVRLDLAELWRYRELLYFLVWRDVKARYRQTFLGASWAILRPFVSMIVFTVIFGHLAGIKPGKRVPYPLFVFTGLLAWTYFQSALGGGGGSVVGSGNLITKVYFPRVYVALAAVAAPLVDFALSLAVLLGLFAWYARAPSWHVVFLPAFVALTLLIALGVSLWIAAATARYRDLPFALPFLLQVWLFLTPVIYPVTLIPERWRWLLALNPMTAAADGFRWALLGQGGPSALVLGVSLPTTLVVLLGGLAYFRQAERTFADLV